MNIDCGYTMISHLLACRPLYCSAVSKITMHISDVLHLSIMKAGKSQTTSFHLLTLHFYLSQLQKFAVCNLVFFPLVP